MLNSNCQLYPFLGPGNWVLGLADSGPYNPVHDDKTCSVVMNRITMPIRETPDAPIWQKFKCRFSVNWLLWIYQKITMFDAMSDEPKSPNVYRLFINKLWAFMVIFILVTFLITFLSKILIVLSYLSYSVLKWLFVWTKKVWIINSQTAYRLLIWHMVFVSF